MIMVLVKDFTHIDTQSLQDFAQVLQKSCKYFMINSDVRSF